MGLPVVTNPSPVISWIDPNTDVNGNLLTAGELTGVQVGIRDLAAAGSVAGTYPNSVSVNATTVQEAASLLFQSGGLVAGHEYAIAARSLAATPPGPGPWSTEYQFQFAPLAPPAAPTGLAIN